MSSRDEKQTRSKDKVELTLSPHMRVEVIKIHYINVLVSDHPYFIPIILIDVNDRGKLN